MRATKYDPPLCQCLLFIQSLFFLKCFCMLSFSFLSSFVGTYAYPLEELRKNIQAIQPWLRRGNMSANKWNGCMMYFLIYLMYCSNKGQKRFNGFSGEWLKYGEGDYNRTEREMRKGSERYQGWMKDDGDALEQSSIKESMRGKKKEEGRKHGNGWWSVVCPLVCS